VCILVFGGSGFIGSRFIKRFRETESSVIINIDKLSYASDQSNLDFIKDDKNYFFYKKDINAKDEIREIIIKHKPKCFINFAAETHVDNSIKSSYEFIKTNVLGVQVLLDLFREYHSDTKYNELKFIQVSTDEVYGDLSKSDSPFTEKNRYSPKNPYSASKAAGDHLVFSYINTYKLPLVITNCSNNYGPNQHREKLIPKTIYSALNNKPIPIYGDGTNIRDWIYVDDHCDALIKIINSKYEHNHFNIGGNCELENLSLVKKICTLLTDKHNNNFTYEKLIKFVTDRPGHDYRYAIDNSFIVKSLDWRPTTSFDKGISNTVDFYLNKYQHE
tara:strand:- start:3723 stop:4715 length:993 start_codon:yes stop_codon:yes gene_type:complete